MKLGDASAIYLGSELVDRIYLGSDQVWPAPPENPELLTNGTFDTDASGWTTRNGAVLTVENGVATLTKGSSSNPFVFQTVQLQAGKTYQFTGSVVEAANPTASIRIGTSPGNLNIINSGAFAVNDWVSPTYTPSADQLVYYSVVHSSQTIGSFIKIDNLSVREVT